MRVGARYLGGPGALQKQSVGLGNRAAELKAIPSYRALTFFRDRLSYLIPTSKDSLCPNITSMPQPYIQS